MVTRGRSPRRSPSYRRGTRHSYEWDTSQIAAASVAPGVTAFTRIDAGFRTALLKGLRIERIILFLRINSTDASLSADFVVGVIVHPGQAAGVPSPSDESAPWMYWERGSALPASDAYQTRRLDVRAKRVFRDSHDQLLVVMENNDSAQTVEYIFGARVLYRLS